jgi:hypothetical protein
MSREKLSDTEVADIRAAVAEGGQSPAVIAARYGVTRQHVNRLVRGEQRQTLPPVDLAHEASVTVAVLSRLEALGIDPNEDVVGATAVALSEKLDSVRASQTAQAAMAAPGLARALQDVLEELRLVVGDGGPRLDALRGDAAILVAQELGYPDPENIDVDRFDGIELIKLHRVRRLAAQRAAYQSNRSGI